MLSDATATGTITNNGPMPKAWLTRFGRTVASQAVDAIGDRISGKGGSHVQVAGMSLTGETRALDEGVERGIGLEQVEWQDREEDLQSLSPSELLLGSTFQLSSGGESGAPRWTAWGQFATGNFEAEVYDTKLDGNVRSGFLGADVSGDRWLGGLALSISTGDGDFSMIDDQDETGKVESTLTSVYPYARLSVNDKVDVWAMAGAGSGDIELVQHADTTRTEDQSIKTDIGMRMGAIGMRGEVLSPEQAGGVSLAIKSDSIPRPDDLRCSAQQPRQPRSDEVRRKSGALDTRRRPNLGGRRGKAHPIGRNWRAPRRRRRRDGHRRRAGRRLPLRRRRRVHRRCGPSPRRARGKRV